MKFLRKHWKTVLALALSFIISFTIILIASVPERYNFKEGDICREDIFAPREIEDRISTERQRDIAAEGVGEQYSLNYKINETKSEELAHALEIINDRRNAGQFASALLKGYIRDNLSGNISGESIDYIISLSEIEYSTFSKSLQKVFAEVMGRGVYAGGSSRAVEDMVMILESENRDEEFINASKEILSVYTKENMEYDKELTQKRKEEARSKVNPIVYKENQRIASNGDKLTKAQIQILTDLGMIKGEGRDISLKYAVGIFAFLLVFYGMAVYYIMIKSGRKRLSVSKIILANLLPVLMLLIILVFAKFDKTLAYVVPVSWCTVLVAVFVSARLSAIMSIYLSFASAIMLGLSEDYILAMIILSVIISIVFKRVDSISGYAKATVIAAVVGVLGITIAMLVTGKAAHEIWRFAVLGGLNGILSSILVIGTMPLFENIFNIITPFKLNDLGNPEKPLLKRLMFEAPGTYHHSLMVGNLAEAACIKIGANNQFARVAAYYHDIGKLRRPLFFVENQMGENPHDSLMPNESADVLKGHVEDGIEIAKQYRLPKDIQDVIIQHHGKTVTGFFFKKEKEINPDAVEGNFRYHGPKPESKEAGIVMLADSCEAAVRSLDEKTEESIRAMVTKIIKHRMAEGELDDCDLSFRELGDIIEAFVSMLGSHFHRRIKYDLKEQDKDGADNRKNS